MPANFFIYRQAAPGLTLARNFVQRKDTSRMLCAYPRGKRCRVGQGGDIGRILALCRQLQKEETLAMDCLKRWCLCCLFPRSCPFVACYLVFFELFVSAPETRDSAGRDTGLAD